MSSSPVVCVVGYRQAAVAKALGSDNIYIRSENSSAGTAFAAYEAFSISKLEEHNPVLIVSLGDRIVPSSIFRRIFQAHLANPGEADITFLTAIHEPPKNHGKGRIIRNHLGKVLCVVEQRDIDTIPDARIRQYLNEISEINCSLYAIRARAFRRHLEGLSNQNAQGQFYLTDVIESVRRQKGEVRTVIIQEADPEYKLLSLDVTRPPDLATMAETLRSTKQVKKKRVAAPTRSRIS